MDAREVFKGNKTPPSFSSSSEEFLKLISSPSSTYPQHVKNHLSPPSYNYTSPSFSYAQASKNFSPIPLLFSSPALDSLIKFSSLPQLKHPAKNLHFSSSSHKPSRSNVSFPTSSSPISIPPPPTNLTDPPNPSFNPTIPQDALNHIASFNLTELIPIIVQLFRNLSANPAYVFPPPVKK